MKNVNPYRDREGADVVSSSIRTANVRERPTANTKCRMMNAKCGIANGVCTMRCGVSPLLILIQHSAFIMALVFLAPAPANPSEARPAAGLRRGARPGT